MQNMVDERFEFAAMIFRLAGRPEYSSPDFGAYNTDYHKEVAKTFAPFAAHETVGYAKKLSFGYGKVFKFTVHIEKKNGEFVFINDITSLYDGNWNEQNSATFLKLFNSFYVDTNYKDFYNSHIDLFEQSSKIFIDDVYSKIDFSWFGKYIDPANLRCIYSLSCGNYAETVNNKFIYCLVMGSNAPVIHEYCHSFANPIANKWYNENLEFRKWCDESVNTKKLPFYNTGIAMANEYVTRAFNVLYEVQHGAQLGEWLSKERNYQYKDSFKYIDQVYDMVIKI